MSRILFFLITLFLFQNSFSQEKSIQLLGEKIVKSISEKDSTKLISCTLNKKLMLKLLEQKKIKEKLSDKDLKQFHQNLDYIFTKINSLLGLNLKSISSRVSMFKLDLSKIEFKVFSSDDSRIPVHNIIANLDHKIFKYLSFSATKVEEQFYLAVPYISISETNPFLDEQRKLSTKLDKDDRGNLIVESKQPFDIDYKTIFSCVEKSPLSFLGYTSKINESDETVLINGSWEYSCFIESEEARAGMTSFKYRIIIKNNSVEYLFDNFIHKKDEDSEFEPIGILKYSYEDQNTQVFTASQFKEMKSSVFYNINYLIHQTNKYIDKCNN